MSAERLAEIQARADAATAGPWRECGRDRGGCVCGLVWSIPGDGVVASTASDPDTPRSDEQVNADARFVAHAKDDIPWLLAEVARLQGAMPTDEQRERWAQRCTTHHFACSCREARFKRLEAEHAHMRRALVRIQSDADLICQAAEDGVDVDLYRALGLVHKGARDTLDAVKLD